MRDGVANRLRGGRKARVRAGARDGAGHGAVRVVLLVAALALAGGLAGASAGAGPASALAAGEFPAPVGFVNDFAGVLSPSEREALEGICRAVEGETGAELAVVTVRTTGRQSIQMYAVELVEAWGIGKRGRDNGVLVLVAVDDRQAWVEVGYGLEGVLPDGKVGAILDRYLLPAFREGRYGEGLRACVEALAAEIRAAGGEGGPPAGGGESGGAAGVAVPLAALVGMALLAGGALLVARRAAPRCPTCRSRLQVREKVLVPATAASAGTALVLYTCPRCGYYRQRQRVLPRLAPAPAAGPSGRGGGFWGGPWWGGSSGGSGGGFGGFGGGRSGGGGAGRSW